MTELGIIYARGTHTTNAYRPPVDFLRWDTDCGFLTGPEKLLAQPADDSVRVMMSFAHSIDFARGSMSFEKWERQLDQLAADKTIWKVTMHDFARYVTALRAPAIASDGLKNDSELRGLGARQHQDFRNSRQDDRGLGKDSVTPKTGDQRIAGRSSRRNSPARMTCRRQAA